MKASLPLHHPLAASAGRRREFRRRLAASPSATRGRVRSLRSGLRRIRDAVRVALVAGAAVASGCGSPSASPTAPSAVEIRGTADPAFSAVRGTVELVTTDTTDLRCRDVRITRQPLVVAKSDRAQARAEVQRGRFALALPLAPAEPGGCDWRPTRLSVAFEQPGDGGAVRTRRGLDLAFVRQEPPPGAVPLPDTVSVVCLLAPTLRPSLPPSLLCDRQRAPEGGYGPLPLFWTPLGADAAPVDVVIRLERVLAFPADTHPRHDTTAIKRAYGLAP